MIAPLERTAFTTSRALEFFSEKELQMQIGHAPRRWPIVLVKELIDNALDACEQAGIAPEITVTVERDCVTVQDNGPGLPRTTLEQSLDYMVRVSDKAHYVSPTRGQLGNALKCVWAAGFVAHGDRGRVDVLANGEHHTITVGLDRIKQEPLIQLDTVPAPFVETGTSVRMHWSKVACLLEPDQYASFYNSDVWSLVASYAAVNPHAAFRLATTDGVWEYPRTVATVAKWLPRDPTSPHWYTLEKLRTLIAAYVADEQAGAPPRTVRAFVAEFAGLSTSAKQKAVTDAANLSRAYLHDLVITGDIDAVRVACLLEAMQAESRPVKPAALGVIGEAHLTQHLIAVHHVSEPSVRYKKLEGTADGLPYVLEVAFGVFTGEYLECRREVSAGANWTPLLSMPFESMHQVFSEVRVDRADPVAILVHLSCPRLEFTDRGKTHAALPPDITAALSKGIKSVTSAWAEHKRHADRENRVS